MFSNGFKDWVSYSLEFMRIGNHKDSEKYNSRLHAKEPIINSPNAKHKCR